MLIYISEGLLEVETKDIRRLSRSTSSVSMTDRDENSFDLQAILCEVAGDAGGRCLVSFYARNLKSSVIFAFESEQEPAWRYGERFLADRGFTLEDVKLNLSPALLEVVLRDVPGLARPDVARRQREEKLATLEDLQRLADEDPESPAGKKAVLKLASERRLQERAERLRTFLVERFATEQEAERQRQFTLQVDELTRRLQEAEKRAGEERRQRVMSETITTAAEKRIQELEELLVGVETSSAQELKQRARSAKLKRQLQEREEGLEAARAELAELQGEKKELAAQVKALEDRLQKAEAGQTRDAQQLDKARAGLAAAVERKNAALAEVKELESRVKELEKEHKEFGRELARLNKTAQAADDLRAQQRELEKALKEARDAAAALEKQLTAAEQEKATAQAAVEAGGEAAALQEQVVQLTAEIAVLREEHERDVRVRRSLEKGAAEDEKRIRELEESLAASGVSQATATDAGETARVEALRTELNELQRALCEERAERAGLEDELDQVNKMVDSLEKAVRGEAGKAAGSAADREKIRKLEANLTLLNEELVQERGRQQELVEALALADKAAGQAASATPPPVAAPAENDAASKSAKPLPHELRPAPKKGALFHPDWDLEGLPCSSADQIFQAWETVFNVQISLEGYPSQYCMAYLVELKVDKVKKLYMVFRLKQNQHTLICVPTKTPKNESELQAAIADGLKFLKSSGFDMEKMPGEYVEGTLGGFFLGA